MQLNDFIAMCISCGIPTSTHFFVLGDWVEAYEATEGILQDIREECAEKIPMPFPDVTTIHSAGDGDFIGMRFVEQPVDPNWAADIHTVIMDKSAKGMAYDGRKPPKQQFSHTVVAHTGRVFRWESQYTGIDPHKGMNCLAAPIGPLDGAAKELIGGTSSWLRLLASISHPANYIIKVSPKLTDKEQRRLERGKLFPTQKHPRYLVVDHDVLVSMRKGGGTHASPIPHHRRGHWMRLAERCRQARALGKQKTWVKPAFVGERKFEDVGNRYEVLLDFSPKQVVEFTEIQ